MTAVINIENLSKYYRLGVIGSRTLREDANRWWAKVCGKPDPKLKIGSAGSDMLKKGEIWALRDINMEVKEGEVLGIIGRNGAGKSTLLKILSRITAPTSGRAVIRGRVGSLLEVGTGFHPELTGRENIYLNGTILGMTKTEVDRKFEEIVVFGEISKFIDTPVKRYSSGMTVRLAFAVAAHLEPEILIVDEVLAVGDAAFQKKCLYKMDEVSAGGRTILIVSHNMQTVQSLCTRCIFINKGELETSGCPEVVINEYLRSADAQFESRWVDGVGQGNDKVRLKSLSAYTTKNDRDSNSFLSKDEIYIEFEVWLKQHLSGLCIGFDLISERGETVLRSYDTDTPTERFQPVESGVNLLRCVIPSGLLNAGRYTVAPRIGIHNQEWIVNSDSLIRFSIVLTHGESPFWNVLHQGNRPGHVAPVLNWILQR